MLLDFLFPQPSQIRSERSASPPIAQPDVVSPSLYSFQVPNDCTFHPILLQPVPPANQCHSTSARDACNSATLGFHFLQSRTTQDQFYFHLHLPLLQNQHVQIIRASTSECLVLRHFPHALPAASSPCFGSGKWP